ncbi:uncharacterized protein LOC142525597 isoform X2 [Primulina tabacum]
MADHVFYRIFDVQNCIILDQFSDAIGELKVDFVFNRKKSLRALSSPKFESNEHDARNAIAFEGTETLVSANSSNMSLHSNGDCNHMVRNNDTNVKQDIDKEELPCDVENGSFIKERTSGGKCANVNVNSSEDKAATNIIDNRSDSGDKIVGCKKKVEMDKVKERKSHLKHVQFEENVKSMKSHGWNDTSLRGGMLDDMSLKDNENNIVLNSSKCRQAISTVKNKSSSDDKNDGCQVNVENKKANDTNSPLKNTCFGERERSNTKSLFLNDTSLKREKVDASSGEDGEAKSNIGNKNVSCVENIGDTCLKRGKLGDKSSKTNGKTSVPCSIISRNIPEMQASGAISVDGELKFEIDKDSGGLRKDLKPGKSSTNLNEKVSDVRTTSPKTLESDHVAGFSSHQKNLKSTKFLNASRGKFSRINDILVDEVSKNKSNEVFESHGQVAKHIKLSSDTTSQLSKTCVYPQNGEMKHGHDSFKRKDLSSVEDLCLGDALSKRAKLDHNSGKGNDMEVLPKMKEKSCGIGQARTNHAHGACKRKDLTLAKDSCIVEGASKKAKLDGFQIPKEEIHRSKHGKDEGEIFEVGPRPINEKRTWLKLGNLSWESLMTAQNEGKLVLLQNLDPTLTSADVMEIIWHAFEEKCMAKMVQRTAMSSPHNGQALLIFNTREIAEKVLKKLDDKCLMLLDQRPLVGCTVLLPEYPRKQTAFVGHLSIDKVRRLMQREMKEAVSTSDYSQPNTIEYEMAMEWSLLQSKSNIWCQKLFELHKVESRKLMANLQRK